MKKFFLIIILTFGVANIAYTINKQQLENQLNTQLAKPIFQWNKTHYNAIQSTINQLTTSIGPKRTIQFKSEIENLWKAAQEVQQIVKQKQELETKQQQFNQQIIQLKQQLDKEKEESKKVKVAAPQIENLKQQITQLNTQISEYKKTISDLEKTVKEQDVANKSLQQNFLQARKTIEEKITASFKGSIASLTNQITTLERQLAEAKKTKPPVAPQEVTQLKQQLASAQSELQKTNQEVIKLRNQLKEKPKTDPETIKKLKNQLNQEEEKIRTFVSSEKYDELNKKIKNVNNEITKMSNELAAKYAKKQINLEEFATQNRQIRIKLRMLIELKDKKAELEKYMALQEQINRIKALL